MSSVGTLFDGFSIVARHVLTQYRRPMTTRVRLLSVDGGNLQLAGGREIASDGDLQGDALYRIVYLPAFQGGSEQGIVTLLDHAQPLLDWLRRQRTQGAVLAASGTAALLLAQSGLLDQGKAAVSKPLAAFFRGRYPQVRPYTRATVVEHAGIFTCSAPTNEWALVSRLVEETVSPISAQWLASAMGILADRRGSPRSSDDPLVASAQWWLAQRFTQSFKIAELAQALAVSHATLIRRFERGLGLTPRAYAQRLRMEAGKSLLRSTQNTIEHIAVTVGYADVRSFRTAFRAHVGLSPSAWRLAGRGSSGAR
ncbi:MAG TPA: helix-turn-helix domain-containing protein [Ramlibacter sp.]|nr:helix-turn-helix domain-containing protein [Ramlibacter sp.]